MIVPDSSVLIALIRGEATPQVEYLRAFADPNAIVVGDLVLLEVLQGARGDAHARRIERDLRVFETAQMLNVDIAIKAASNYRKLRALGVTVRKTVDLIIGTFCIENDHQLLHDDRDFDPMVAHLGLRLA